MFISHDSEPAVMQILFVVNDVSKTAVHFFYFHSALNSIYTLVKQDTFSSDSLGFISESPMEHPQESYLYTETQEKRRRKEKENTEGKSESDSRQ